MALACTADSVCRLRQISWICSFRVFEPCYAILAACSTGVLRLGASVRPVWPYSLSLDGRRLQKVLARIGHCRAYELVRVWGGSSLSHLLSANAPPLTALFVWRLAAEKNGTPFGGPGAALSQGWPHFTHWTKSRKRY
jgi:hypothetical protein